MHSRVAGTITDNATGLPISGVSVASAPGNYAATSDSTGNYSIDIPNFHISYTLKFSKAGYLTVQQAGVTVSKGKATSLNLVMMMGS